MVGGHQWSSSSFEIVIAYISICCNCTMLLSLSDQRVSEFVLADVWKLKQWEWQWKEEGCMLQKS